jgi:hypothetical protein
MIETHVLTQVYTFLNKLRSCSYLCSCYIFVNHMQYRVEGGGVGGGGVDSKPTAL